MKDILKRITGYLPDLPTGFQLVGVGSTVAGLYLLTGLAWTLLVAGVGITAGAALGEARK
jgi:hypothetical protein